METINQQ